MDAGIIMAFKRNYRHFHIQWMLEEVESGKKADDQYSNSMKVDDFLTIPEEDIVCEIPDESSIMAEIIEIFNEGPEESDHEDPDEADDSVETAIISTSEALKSLEVMRAFLLQQEDSGEYIKKIESIEKFVNAKRVGLMKQTNLNQYFNL